MPPTMSPLQAAMLHIQSVEISAEKAETAESLAGQLYAISNAYSALGRACSTFPTAKSNWKPRDDLIAARTRLRAAQINLERVANIVHAAVTSTASTNVLATNDNILAATGGALTSANSEGEVENKRNELNDDGEDNAGAVDTDDAEADPRRKKKLAVETKGKTAGKPIEADSRTRTNAPVLGRRWYSTKPMHNVHNLADRIDGQRIYCPEQGCETYRSSRRNMKAHFKHNHANYNEKQFETLLLQHEPPRKSSATKNADDEYVVHKTMD